MDRPYMNEEENEVKDEEEVTKAADESITLKIQDGFIGGKSSFREGE